jgi:chorismate mutase-like protein
VAQSDSLYRRRRICENYFVQIKKSVQRSVLVGSMAVAAVVLCGLTPAMATPWHAASNLPTPPATHPLGGLGPLTDLVIQRLQVSDQVAASKFGTGQSISDPVREQQELDSVRQSALQMGLDPTTTVQFFQNQITASKVVQQGLFDRWTANPALAPTTRPDLATIRTELDQITKGLLAQLQATQSLRAQPVGCTVSLDVARVSGEVLDHLDALHRQALDVALQPPVCSPA